MSTPPGEEKDVLRSLPRSRPGRSTTRRDAARAKRAASAAGAAPRRAGGKPVTTTGSNAATKTEVTAARVTVARATPTPAKDPAAKPSARAARIPNPQPKVAASDAKPRALRAPRRSAVSPERIKKRATIDRDAPVPAAGYANAANGHGNADPAGTIVQIADAGASLLRGVLKRLPL